MDVALWDRRHWGRWGKDDDIKNPGRPSHHVLTVPSPLTGEGEGEGDLDRPPRRVHLRFEHLQPARIRGQDPLDGPQMVVRLVGARRPPSPTVLTASSSLCRATITAASVWQRFSLLRSTMGPIASWTALSCWLTPSMPLNVSRFWTSPSMPQPLLLLR